ncbi:nucleoside triphosphate pyrophosphohydrolase [Streptomyces sp. NBC_01803]|uniref:nucleoside triphosphate pyrophosphohydrolase n=1 Tax=Streptomyces sp. NBC_01803 TaxID=2975946 RepID=UPI002DD7A9D4|nr:nucleoside triphosphate pyrophosphohydrolase [Streptomyces sp. NBC_01803]WSA44579.1 nucleoside triphosphate pyrophosphohydrolase [Streptomyces sp. NBC_01803]
MTTSPSDSSPSPASPVSAASPAPSAPAGRIVLLTTTHRVAPGLLSWPAWQALRDADLVLCRDTAHPQLPYLKEAGIAVEAVATIDADRVVGAGAGGRLVVVLTSAEGEPRLTDGLAALAGSGRATTLPELELLPGSYDLPGARLLDLVQVMDRIRAVCPWASTQTSEDLAPYGVEEMYELIEAIEAGDRAELREELGDVLLQVVFHARIAAEDTEEPFDIDDVAGGIVAKLIHRHPHVFGDERAETADDVKALWLRAKAAEKGRTSVTDGIPLGQPGLALAAKLSARARTAGVDVPLPPAPAGDFGYRLLALATEAEAAGTDPETALRTAARAYRDAIRAAEARPARQE